MRHAAEALNSPVLPLSLRERLLGYIEGPWAPPANQLPTKQRPDQHGNATDGFRQPVLNNHDLCQRLQLKQKACSSEKRWSLTDWTTVFEYDVPVRTLAPKLSGLRILHISDVHFMSGCDRSTRELGKIAEALEQGKIRADLVVLSGDIITRSPEDLDNNALRQLYRLSCVCEPCFMVYGNHDYHGHTPALISRQLESVGFTDINNASARLVIDGAPINIIGVDDAYFGRPKPPTRINPEEPNIVLTHNLDAIRSNFPREVDLILSGHTHWGEVRLFNGSQVMKLWGYNDNVNGHTRHWDVLSDRTLSYVGSGLARYYVRNRLFRQPPSIAVHSLYSSPL
jgi:predicted MPP superfamily phosphohydrolase